MSSPSDKKQSIAVWDDDLPDVVATQGAFLKSRPPTPVIWKMVHPNFHFTLCWKLEFLLDAQESRCRKYGREAAEEWLIGHTPTELRQKRAAEIEAMLEAWDAPSPPSPPSRDKPDNAKLPLQKRTRRVRSRPPPRLTTPSPSDVDGETPAPPSAVPITTSKRKIQSSVEPVGPPLDNRARKKQRITELEDSS